MTAFEQDDLRTVSPADFFGSHSDVANAIIRNRKC
jgi:hypothetical protein